MVKALGLFSGGLDSVLACKLLMEQGIEILGVCFISPFFSSDGAKIAAKALEIDLEEIDFSKEHLAMVKEPLSGYGSNMNPCIDCHALMLEWAGELLQERNCDFLFTGEVLGERPMSQNRNSLNRVAKLSGYREKILRPLSALLLPETEMERSGLVDRSRLAGISGRSRKPQMDLASRFGISTYETPSGGCLLTDPNYSKRLSNLFTTMPDCEARHCKLLRMGRLFWLGEGTFCVVGRNESENDRLEEAFIEGDVKLHVDGDIPGATALLIGAYHEDCVKRAGQLALRYSAAKNLLSAKIAVYHGKSRKTIEVASASAGEIESWRSP